MKRSSGIAIVVIIVIVAAAVGSYLIFHKSTKTVVTTTTTTVKTPTTSSPNKPVATVSNAVYITKTNSGISGVYLAKPTGEALYTYNSDTAGVSNCTGSCLTNWPAYQDTGSTSSTLPTNISTIKRTDNGETQFTYKGLPLYTFIGDSNGSVTGNNVSGFVVARQ